MKNENPALLNFQEIGRIPPAARTALAGGKGANLAELKAIADIGVPEGFCITTEAYKEITERNEAYNLWLDQLNVLKPDDRKGIREISAELRGLIENTVIPEHISEELTRYLERSGVNEAYAIRSSATAEDLPAASFAGQQDSYLNVSGKESILAHIRKCWASLFTERAATYRIMNGFGHRRIYLAVIVQKMVFPQAAGILFTADPVSSNRKILSIDAGFGLGESLVSGLVNPDVYKVREGKIIEKKIAVKQLAIHACKEGGTMKQEIEPARQNIPALTDSQVLRLERISRTIEAHFGYPQDIEWCLADDVFYIVQSRPVTTLFPIPDAADKENRVYISVGHQQMMTDAIKPLGLSFFLLTTRAPMRTAGGRLFVDVTPQLSSPQSRQNLLNGMGQHDPLMKDALLTILDRDDFIKLIQEEQKEPINGSKSISVFNVHTPIKSDPAIVGELIGKNEASVNALKENIQSQSGSALMDFILEDLGELKKFLFDPQSFTAIMASVNASAWINRHMHEWLGEKNVADTLAQSAPGNITSEMGLALLDVADAIRPYPEVIAYLQSIAGDDFLDKLPHLKGGPESYRAITRYLDKYGMRCAGEIDITKPRWSEEPSTLVSLILSNIRNFEPGESKRKFDKGKREALRKEQELLQRLNQLPDGARKAKETKEMIALLRNFAGYREYPKYGMVSRYSIYRTALLKEAERLVQYGVISEKEDICYLTFEELREVIRSNWADQSLLAKRKNEYRSFEKMTPPRVITSDGEIVAGSYQRERLPEAALAGLAVSSGIVEGRARVILNMHDANLEEGDILVTIFTDPSWTPLFVSVKGLITEVGGLMTHGAVIAREYGLPAVVGVEKATTLIKDGQRIRVNGTEGYVELL